MTSEELIEYLTNKSNTSNSYKYLWDTNLAPGIIFLMFFLIIVMTLSMITEYMLDGKVFFTKYGKRHSDYYTYYTLLELIMVIPGIIGFILAITLSWAGLAIDIIFIGGIFTLLIFRTKNKARDSKLVKQLLEEKRKKDSTKKIKNDTNKQTKRVEESIQIEEEVVQIEFDEVWEQQYFKACFDIGFQPDKKYNTNQVLRNKYNLLEELYANQALMNEIKFKKQEENITSSTQFYYDNQKKINEYIKMTEIDVIKNKYKEYIQMRDIEIW